MCLYLGNIIGFIELINFEHFINNPFPMFFSRGGAGWMVIQLMKIEQNNHVKDFRGFQPAKNRKNAFKLEIRFMNQN